jgi:hypothetical protein
LVKYQETGTGFTQYQGASVSLSADGRVLVQGAYYDLGMRGSPSLLSLRCDCTSAVARHSRFVRCGLIGCELILFVACCFFAFVCVFALPFDLLRIPCSAVALFLVPFVRSEVHSYARQTNQSEWTFVVDLTGSGTVAAYFGRSVGLSADGTTLVVGEYGANFVWVYTAAPVGSGNWTFQRKLAQTEAGFTGSVSFGYAVALSASGNTLVIGAYTHSSKGAAVVFSRNSTSAWSAQSGILADGSAGGNFSWSVAIDGAGDRIVIGARFDAALGSGNGAVYIYSRNATTLNWSYQQRVLPSDSISTGFRYFGWSLSLSSSGDALVVGAYREGATGMVTGAWWHFEWNGTLFEQVGLKKVGQPTGNNAQQGYSIALSADGQTVIGSCIAASALQHMRCAALAFHLAHVHIVLFV